MEPEPLDIRYARSGDVAIAYHVCGDGPLDLVVVSLELRSSLLALLEPLLAHLELRLQLRFAEVERGLALLELFGTSGQNLLTLVEPLLLALVAAMPPAGIEPAHAV